jgi:hypothetical protein
MAERRKSTNAYISESELHYLSNTYHRLYQMPPKSQARLRVWINMNRDVIRSWELGDFLKTEHADILEDTKPEKHRWPSSRAKKSKGN